MPEAAYPGGIIAVSRITEFDAGFICGLVVGEGSFTGDRKQPVLAIKLHEDDLAPLQLVQEKLGGKIYGPYCHDDRRYYVWRLWGNRYKRRCRSLQNGFRSPENATNSPSGLRDTG